MESLPVYNGSLLNEGTVPCSELKSLGMYYEVIRVIQGRFAFLTDHINRLFSSLRLSGVQNFPDRNDLLSELRLCVRQNHLQNGNIRLSVFPDSGKLHRLIEIVPHIYPGENDYKEGVTVAVVRFVRENPNVKKWNQSMKDVVKRFKSIHNVYEVLMYDRRGLLTEGSQSNLFFIEGNTVVTAPDELVLKGITRDYVIKAIKSLGLNLKYDAVPVVDVLKYDAVFITGTSPKVLPVREILSCCHADVEHPVLKKIMSAYEVLLMNGLE